MNTLELDARLQIAELVNRYATYFDEGRTDDLAALFLEDGEIEFSASIGSMPSSLRGRAAIARHMRQRWEDLRPAQRRHFVTNVIIDVITSDEARASSYVLLGSIENDRLGLPISTRLSDVLRRTSEGRWLFERRVITPDVALP